MSGRSLIVMGSVQTMLGIIFTLQGLGILAGSAMTGVTLWAVVGPVVAVAGLALVRVGVRRTRRGPAG